MAVVVLLLFLSDRRKFQAGSRRENQRRADWLSGSRPPRASGFPLKTLHYTVLLRTLHCTTHTTTCCTVPEWPRRSPIQSPNRESPWMPPLVNDLSPRPSAQMAPNAAKSKSVRVTVPQRMSNCTRTAQPQHGRTEPKVGYRERRG